MDPGKSTGSQIRFLDRAHIKLSNVMLVLLPADKSGVFQESGYKQNLVCLYSSSGGKVIFALLD